MSQIPTPGRVMLEGVMDLLSGIASARRRSRETRELCTCRAKRGHVLPNMTQTGKMVAVRLPLLPYCLIFGSGSPELSSKPFYTLSVPIYYSFPLSQSIYLNSYSDLSLPPIFPIRHLHQVSAWSSP
jgi:hypothetical protein